VEAVEYFFFHFHLRIKLVASEFASTSSFILQSASASTLSAYSFRIPASCFIKNASASGFSKNQMFSSLLPLPASSILQSASASTKI